MKRRRQSHLINIGGLPEELVREILMRLPFEDAVRTSVLSRKWTYAWTERPRLVFDDRFSEVLNTRKSIIDIISHVLSLHHGPLNCFKLSESTLELCSMIVQFVLFVVKAGAKDFTLHIPKGQYYMLQSPIFTYGQQLDSLDLRFCLLEPPTGFNGFSRLVRLALKEVFIIGSTFSSLISNCALLKSLDLCFFVITTPIRFNGLSKLERLVLQEVCILGSTLSSLISNCSVLEYLCLVSYTNCGRLDIISPNLEEFHFMGLCESICFTNTPKLATVLISTYDNECGHKEIEDPSPSMLCGRLPLVEELNVDHFYSKVYTPIQLSEVEPTEMEGFSDVTLDHLIEFELLDISGVKCELQFIELILAKSPLMKKCRIKPHCDLVDEKGLWFSKELSRLRRASPFVEIIYEDLAGDRRY